MKGKLRNYERTNAEEVKTTTGFPAVKSNQPNQREYNYYNMSSSEVSY